MAPIAPAAVEFQIHQVVPTFQINMLSSECRKNFIRLVSWSANNSKGTQAIKISGVNPAWGHAQTKSKPDNTLNKNGGYFFKNVRCLSVRKFGKKTNKSRLKPIGKIKSQNSKVKR